MCGGEEFVIENQNTGFSDDCVCVYALTQIFCWFQEKCVYMFVCLQPKNTNTTCFGWRKTLTNTEILQIIMTNSQTNKSALKKSPEKQHKTAKEILIINFVEI